jgi:hypothetical protein
MRLNSTIRTDHLLTVQAKVFKQNRRMERAEGLPFLPQLLLPLKELLKGEEGMGSGGPHL